MRRKIIVLFISLILYSCGKSLVGMPTELLDRNFDYNKSIHMISDAATIQECDEVYLNNNKFSVCYINDSKTSIKYIFTYDTTYYTRERVKVGDTYSKVKTKTKENIIEHEGWGNLLHLPSGWIAVYEWKEKVVDSSKVKFIFYRN